MSKPEAPRRVRYRAADAGIVWTVLKEFDGWLWLDRGDGPEKPPTTARVSWVEDVEIT